MVGACEVTSMQDGWWRWPPAEHSSDPLSSASSLCFLWQKYNNEIHNGNTGTKTNTRGGYQWNTFPIHALPRSPSSLCCLQQKYNTRIQNRNTGTNANIRGGHEQDNLLHSTSLLCFRLLLTCLHPTLGSSSTDPQSKCKNHPILNLSHTLPHSSG